MRILVTSVPASGHVLPLIPLARRLQQSGDDVVWATGPDQCEQLETEGFTTIAIGPTIGAWFQQLASRTRGRPGDGVPHHRTTHWFAPRLFGEVGAPLLVDALLAFARTFRPEAILFESRSYAAPPVARLVDALPVLLAVTTLLPPEVEVLVNDAVTPLWRELGLDTPSYAGVFDGLALSPWPAVLDDPAPYGDLVVHRLRPPTAPSPLEPRVGEWIAEQGSRPIIYATLGTLAGGNVAVLRSILDGLRPDDIAVLMTVGPSGDPAALGVLPPHHLVERFVPQDTILAACRAVVSHAGSGTTLGALAHGLPLVMLPQGADQFINADRCERAGLGRSLLPADITPDAVRSAVHDVLDDLSYRENARRVQAEMASGMSPDDVVRLIRGSVEAAT